MRRVLFLFTACTLLFSPATLRAQQSTIMLQIVDGYTGVAIATHPISIAIGATPAEVQSRKNTIERTTDARGVLILTLPSASAAWLQVWVDNMHACTPHPETQSFSLAQIAAKGLQTPNKCSPMQLRLSPAHLSVYVRELSPSERSSNARSQH
jgi:hypothetical protein